MYKTTSHSLKLGMLILFTLYTGMVRTQSVENDAVKLDKLPPRIIRACCAFGYDLKLWGVPFVSIDQVISIADLGEHRYMGNKREGNGTIYTRKGGFIDIGHLRDQMDWTRYLYVTILNGRGKGEVHIRLRNEAGRKRLCLNVPARLDNNDCILLAGKIAYDFSLWHEISTWFGASAIPLVPEKFSSFSVEDIYSNLLGIHVGMKTLHSKIPFNAAATKNIVSALDSLGAVKTAEETYHAYDAIKDVWYTDEKRIPRTDLTLKRDPDVLVSSRPWIVPDTAKNISDPTVLNVPLSTTKGELLTNFYRFTIDPNYRFPLEEIFPNRRSSRIDQNDFAVLLNKIADELLPTEQDEPVGTSPKTNHK